MICSCIPRFYNYLLPELSATKKSKKDALTSKYLFTVVILPAELKQIKVFRYCQSLYRDYS